MNYILHGLSSLIKLDKFLCQWKKGGDGKKIKTEKQDASSDNQFWTE